jgi:transcriptional regulator with XRE-family HTH domain
MGLDKSEIGLKMTHVGHQMKPHTTNKTEEPMTMLKRRRLVKGLTLSQLAKRIGVSTAACSAWETGRNSPSPRAVPKLARALGLDTFELTKILSPEAV